MPKKKNVAAKRKGRKKLTQQQKARQGIGMQGKGLATTVAKILGPIILKEVGGIGAKILGKKIKKKLGGKGLLLAGQRVQRGKGIVLAGRGPGKKKRRKPSQKQLAALARGRAKRMKNLQ